MAGTSAKRVPTDPGRSTLTIRGKSDYRCRKFGCTQSHLRAAVKVLGPAPTDVRKYLRQRAANE